MKYIIKDKEINVVFDGEYYIGKHGSFIIKRYFKQDVIKLFENRFCKEVKL